MISPTSNLPPCLEPQSFIQVIQDYKVQNDKINKIKLQIKERDLLFIQIPKKLPH